MAYSLAGQGVEAHEHGVVAEAFADGRAGQGYPLVGAKRDVGRRREVGKGRVSPGPNRSRLALVQASLVRHPQVPELHRCRLFALHFCILCLHCPCQELVWCVRPQRLQASDVTVHGQMGLLNDDFGPMVNVGPGVPDLNTTVKAASHHEFPLVRVCASRHSRLQALDVLGLHYIGMRKILFDSVQLRVQIPLPY